MRRHALRTLRAGCSSLGVALVLGLAPGCSRGMRETAAPRAPASAVGFRCQPELPAPHVPLRRLSRDQLRNTYDDLIALLLPAEEAAMVQRRLAPLLDAVPPDTVTKEAPFSGMDQVVSEQHVMSYGELARRAAELLTENDARVTGLLACKRGAKPSACIDAFVRRVGRRAFRHALSPEEFRFVRASYTASNVDANALRALLRLMLSAPQFLYQVEQLGRALPDKPGVYELSPSALATRLAYHFWRTMPDEPLLASAERGELASDDGLRRVVERMLDDPRALRSMHAFVSEWFQLDSLRPLDALVGDPVFDAFAGADLPSPDLRDAMIADVLDSFTYHVDHGGSYADWLASPYSFARSEELAKLYEVTPWDGRSEPPRFAALARAGLLTRAALLATGTANTRPISKGVFLRKRVLCDDLPPPPPNASNVPPPLSPERTTREVVQALTEQPDSSCASCHRYQINPLGFATENYDALGRRRSAQTLFSADGHELGKRPVDTHGVPRLFPFDTREVAGARELTGAILESGKGEACFARQYLRFTYGRAEDPPRDGCMLEAIRTALSRPDGLREALRTPALSPSFRQRTLGAVAPRPAARGR